MVGVPEYISTSQARLFEGCPKAFEYRYVTHLDLADDHDENRDFGRAVHAGLAAGYRLLQAASDAGSTEPLDDAQRNMVRGFSIEALEERWFAEGLSVGEAYDEAHDHVLAEWGPGAPEAGVPCVFDRIPSHWTVVGVEQGFRRQLRFANTDGEPVVLAVTGVLDLELSNPATKTLRVVDHKTGARLLSWTEMRDDDQLRLYGAVAQDLYPDYEIQAGMNRTGTIGSARQLFFDVDATSINGILNKLLRTRTRIDAAAAANEFPARPGRQCGWCDYRSVCPGAIVLQYAENLA